MNTALLVPSDFSKASTVALKHAIHIANQTKAKVILVNFCGNNSKIEDAKTKLEKQSNSVDHNCSIECLVRVGSYNDIPTLGLEISAEMIFLGTHGAQGLQKLFGSNALKMVTKSEIPFIVVQENSPEPTGYKNILSPTSFHFESKQKVKFVAKIAEQFGSKITFIYRDTDPVMKSKSIQNLKVMNKFLSEKNIATEAITSSGKNFNADTISACGTNSIDLIAIMNMQKNDVLGTGLFGDNYEQELIMNPLNVPVLILSPKNSSLLGSVIEA